MSSSIASTSSTMQWPEGDSGYGGSSNSTAFGAAKGGAPRWGIQTDGEKYVDALENRIAKVKTRPAASSSSNSNAQVSFSNELYDEGEDADVTGDLSEDDYIPDANSETTCLLYDAAKQDRLTRRRLRKQGKKEQLEKARQRRSSASSSSSSPGPGPRVVDSAYYDGDSLVWDSRRGSADIFNEEEGMVAEEGKGARIQFSDLVKISGGIRRPTSRHRTPRSTSMLRRSSVPTTHGSGSCTPLYSRSPSNTGIPNDDNAHHTPSSSAIAHKPTLSRPASFLSEVSRASTPTSLYAPLLLPSKTAPSPSRPFFLTPTNARSGYGTSVDKRQRQDGQISYRGIVAEQKEAKKREKKWEMWQRERRRSERVGLLDEEVEEDGGGKKKRGRGCMGGLWNCFGRTSEDDEEEEEERENLMEEEDVQPSLGESSEDDDEAGDDNGQHRMKSKSETTVLFGSKPWRWFKLNYWLYRMRGICGRNSGDDVDDDGSEYV